MDIEKMYEDTKRKIKQTTVLEENTFTKDLLKQDRSYYKMLNNLIQFYPIAKTEDSPENHTTYATKLSELNGISKMIQTLTKSIQGKVELFDTNLKQSNRDITNLKEMYSNLATNNGDLEQLDMTSKRLLKDYVRIYSTQRILVWVKSIIMLYLLYRLVTAAMKYTQIWTYVFLWVVGIILLFVVNYFYIKWQNTISLPDSATLDNDTKISAMSCQDSEYGCCPDGITPSVKNKLNCGCAESTYGCCPDGANKNEDGSCAPFSNLPSIPCNQSAYGCCPDRMTISNSTGSNCSSKRIKPPLCARTQYGCCPDGNTKSNVDRSNCVGSCAGSEFGCCPDGVTISNEDRSNCNVPNCASTRHGCCQNGTARNINGSNCI